MRNIKLVHQITEEWSEEELRIIRKAVLNAVPNMHIKTLAAQQKDYIKTKTVEMIAAKIKEVMKLHFGRTVKEFL